MQLYNLYIIIAIHCPICQHIRLLFYGKYSTARIPACIIMQFLCFWKLSTISVIHHKVDKTHYSITQWVLARNGINEHTILVHTPTYAGRDACTCTRTVQQTVQCTNTQCQSSKSNSVCAQAVTTLHSFGLRLASIALLAFLDQLGYCLWHRKKMTTIMSAISKS